MNIENQKLRIALSKTIKAANRLRRPLVDEPDYKRDVTAYDKARAVAKTLLANKANMASGPM